MKNSNLTGWKDVLSFTFVQTMKSKTYIISFVILLILAAVSMPVMSLVTSLGKEDPNAVSPIEKVYVDSQNLSFDTEFTPLLQEKALSGISFETMKEDHKVVSDRIEESENTSVILTITSKNGMYSLAFEKASKGPVKDSSLSQLGAAVAEQFEQYKLNALGITADQLSMINSAVTTKVSMFDVNGEAIVKKDTSISMNEYWFVYALLFIVLMVNIFASTQIATSIVTEKSTRVIEYLLTSVKPLSLIVGKIIAMLTATLLQMASLITVAFISNKVSASLSSSKEEALTKYLPANIFDNINIINIVLCIVVILLGMIFYATLAGLAGATVSRQEEIQEGLTLFTFTNIIGAYIGIAALSILSGGGVNSFVTFSFLFPLSSPFILPGAILIGKVSVPLIAASIAMLIVFNILLSKFVAKIFETLILHNGNTIKPKELIKIFKAS